VFSGTFGSKREDETGGWRKLHNEELRNLYPSPNISSDQFKEDEMGGAYNTHRKREKFIQNFRRKNLREETTWGRPQA
jgi:hypothetical protein